MKKQTLFFIGIDVSKLWFDASLMAQIDFQKQAMQTERFDNTKDGLKKFHRWLKLNQVSFDRNTLVVVENTGIYHRLLWHYCTLKNLPIHIGNAAHIKWSFGIARGKNDVLDSQRLCQYACKEADQLKASPALDPRLMELKDLMSSRSKLIKQLQGIRRHLGELKTSNIHTVQSAIEKAHQAALKGLKSSLETIEKQIKTIVSENQAMYDNYKLLITVPGIGHFTAIYLICCTNNFHNKYIGKQLACYAGVAPFEHTSGKSIKGRNRVHKMANKELKSMLHLCSLACIQRYPEFIHYYERKQQEGKHALTIPNAIKNKLLLRVAAVINNQKPYEEKHPYESQTFRKKYLQKS
jgi:transposase